MHITAAVNGFLGEILKVLEYGGGALLLVQLVRLYWMERYDAQQDEERAWWREEDRRRFAAAARAARDDAGRGRGASRRAA